MKFLIIAAVNLNTRFLDKETSTEMETKLLSCNNKLRSGTEIMFYNYFIQIEDRTERHKL